MTRKRYPFTAEQRERALKVMLAWSREREGCGRCQRALIEPFTYEPCDGCPRPDRASIEIDVVRVSGWLPGSIRDQEAKGRKSRAITLRRRGAI